MVRVLASHQCGPGSNPGIDMWVEFVVGSLPCSERFFSGYSGSPISPKTNTSKFQVDPERTDTEKRALKLLGASWVNKLHYITIPHIGPIIYKMSASPQQKTNEWCWTSQL